MHDSCQDKAPHLHDEDFDPSLHGVFFECLSNDRAVKKVLPERFCISPLLYFMTAKPNSDLRYSCKAIHSRYWTEGYWTNATIAAGIWHALNDRWPWLQATTQSTLKERHMPVYSALNLVKHKNSGVQASYPEHAFKSNPLQVRIVKTQKTL